MCRAIEVENTPPAVFDDEEAVKCLEGQRGNGEEVERGDNLTMVAQERQPLLRFARIVRSLEAFKVARDRWFGNFEPELEQFTVDARRAPSRIVGLHASDQFADFFGHLRSAPLP